MGEVVNLPQLGSLWSIKPEYGNHTVLLADLDHHPYVGVLLAADRDPGPEDVALQPDSVEWAGDLVPLRTIACRQLGAISINWLEKRLGQLGAIECGVAGWLHAPQSARTEIEPGYEAYIGSAYTGRDDPRLEGVRRDARIAREFTELSHEEISSTRSS